MYLEEQTAIYGTDHIYGIDPFNEVDSPNWNEDFLAKVSKKIYESIYQVDAEAKWLQMTWMFYHDQRNGHNPESVLSWRLCQMTSSYCWITIVTVQKYGGIRKCTTENHIGVVLLRQFWWKLHDGRKSGWMLMSKLKNSL
ncbi:alpha-N-acetylglucosaminidase TIM-barrel domain-containing protein [Bacteroides thetaiotaomicron]|uniref:alpha-N-acetylglucosaminidase TIM-barrel domain-containing protein n=1 Tax=Bacteroides thetaiotaomicron TaxID=818 RepID=UPI00403FF98A